MGKKKNNPNLKGGFTYYLDDEKIRWYLSLSCEMRLRWLEEAAQFTYRVLSQDPVKKQIWEDFRKGKI
jgi:hypothetical protein